MMCRYIVFIFMIAETAIAVLLNKSHLWWNYEDQKSWQGEKCHGGGYRQSPIDIDRDNVIFDFKHEFIVNGELVFHGYRKVLATAVNNGHTVQFSCEGNKEIHPVMTGGPLVKTYRLEQVHFHWLSEHALDGYRYPLEIHLVHVRTDLSVKQALAKPDGLAIIALFCSVKKQLSIPEEERVYEVMSYMPKLNKTGSRMSGVIVDFDKLLGNASHSYFAYSGSLTSPECNEAVIWIIFETPVFISQEQHQQVMAISGRRHNARRLQPLKKHRVYRPRPATVFRTPTVLQKFADAYNSVSEFFRNLTHFFSRESVARRLPRTCSYSYDKNRIECT